ncbi:MAG: thioesterase superfamily protein [Phycisphaerales bacterium]|nr:thioesterase superfamily protein [Phycisphaerales bacterium]
MSATPTDSPHPPAAARQLPHTAGCLVCGRENPHGLHLDLRVDAAGTVATDFSPGPTHIGFQGVTHGGVLATVLDEAMVWAATWAGRRFCLCGEMTIRFRKPAHVGEPLRFEARVTVARSRLVTTVGVARDAAGAVVAEATGKYVPLPDDQNRAFVATLVDDPTTDEAARVLRAAAAGVS